MESSGRVISSRRRLARFLHGNGRVVREEAGAVQRDGGAGRQALEDFDHAGASGAGLDDTLHRLALGDGIDHFAGRAQHHALLRHQHGVLAPGDPLAGVHRAAGAQSVLAVDVDDDVESAARLGHAGLDVADGGANLEARQQRRAEDDRLALPQA